MQLKKREERRNYEHIPHFREQIKAKRVTVEDKTKGFTFEAVLELSDDEVEVILEGGQLRYVQAQLQKETNA